MDHLIEKYINNSLTQEELDRLEVWLQSDTKNRIAFENIVAHLRHNDREFESARKRIYERIVSENPASAPVTIVDRSHRTRFLYLKIAAAIVVTLAASVLVFRYINQPLKSPAVAENLSRSYIEKETAYGQQLAFTLPDGSLVKLNAGSRLVFPKAFSPETRKVELFGEAFFDVEPDAEKPFIISAKGVNIRVLGTSFNIRSYEEDAHTSVAVRSGVVRVTSLDGSQEIMLRENDLANYSNNTNILIRDIITDRDLVFGWINRELVLKDHTIDQILKQLSRWYGVEFELKGNSLDNTRKFTTKYKDPSLKSVMESLSYVYEFKYEINERKVTIIKK